MDLKKALRAHEAGKLKSAEIFYSNEFERGSVDPVLYQNYCALLRKIGNIQKASLVAKKGAELFPYHIGISLNRSLILSNEAPSLAIQINLRAIRLILNRSGLRPTKQLKTACENTVGLLHENGLYNWAYSLNTCALAVFKDSVFFNLKKLTLLDELGIFKEATQEYSDVIAKLESMIVDVDEYGLAEICFGLGTYYFQKNNTDRALVLYRKGMVVLENSKSLARVHEAKIKQMINGNSWNYSIMLLQRQYFKEGWRLFEYGLCVPANGRQRWQRALWKPFSNKQIPLWKGEALESKRLLILEEQAIGDVMMFMTLIPSLIEEALKIEVLISDRIYDLYKNGLSEYIKRGKLNLIRHRDITDHKVRPDRFDYQTPIGSICQYRFESIDCFGKHLPIIHADNDTRNRLRVQYGASKKIRLIGISWRGGGADRMLQKSMTESEFSNIVKDIPGIKIICLQYGEVEESINIFKGCGIDVGYDRSINPLKDMNKWCSQVAACDGIISVANTTIHGAGSLGIPTMCMLSRHLDWRWLAKPDVSRSYWYPSVGIARQSKDGCWEEAISNVRAWVLGGCPMPDGACYSGSDSIT